MLKSINTGSAQSGSMLCGMVLAVFLWVSVSPVANAQTNPFTDNLGPQLENSDLIDRVNYLLTTGYPVEVVYSHEVSRGNAIYAVVEAAIIVDPQRETEFRWIADQMLGGLPYSACGCLSFEKEDEWNEISYDALEPKTIEEAARVFFEDELHLARLNDEFYHGLFPVAELQALLDAQELWYRILPVRDHPVAPGVFVSIYKDEEQVIVDGNLGLVLDAIARGDELMPVIFQYYREDTVPINRYPEQISSEEVSDVLKDYDIEVSPPPNWKAGDFHAYMTLEEIEEIEDIPEKEDVDEELWNQIEAKLGRDGFLVPVLLTSESGFSVELHNSVERVSVARELGIEVIPVVLFEPPSTSGWMSACRRIVRNEFEDPLHGAFGTAQGGPPLPPDDPPPEEPPMEPPMEPPKVSP